MAKKKTNKKKSKKDKNKNTGNNNKKKKKKETSKVTFPNSTFTITFSNEEEYDILKYSPSKRFKAIRTVEGSRDFTLTKLKTKDPDTPDTGDPSYVFGDLGDDNAITIAVRLANKKTKKGNQLNTAQIVGILANIQDESNYNPANQGDKNSKGEYTSFGICQWHDDRATKMKNYVGDDWATDLEGQVDYLWKDLNGSYKDSTFKAILKQASDNDEKSAKKTAEIFCKKYEVPADKKKEVEDREKIASELWKKVRTLDASKLAGKGTPDFSNVTWELEKQKYEMRMDTDGPTINNQKYGSGSHDPKTSLYYNGKTYISPDRTPYVVGGGGDGKPYETSQKSKLAVVVDHTKKTYTFAIVADFGHDWGECSLKTAWNLGYTQKQANGKQGPESVYSMGYFNDIKVNLSKCKSIEDVNNAILKASAKAVLK